MTEKEFIKIQIEKLPQDALLQLCEFIRFQQFNLGIFDNDTDYLLATPNFVEDIKSIDRDNDWVSENEVQW